ncbi:MAG TPA: hypothetical protein VGE78_07550, partial [Agromyces sp.]
MTDESPKGTPADRDRWRKYLAAERAEAAVYLELAARRDGEEREILLALAAAEGRHEAHWLALLGGDDSGVPRADVRTRLLASLARRFGSIFVPAVVTSPVAPSVLMRMSIWYSTFLVTHVPVMCTAVAVLAAVRAWSSSVS